MTNKLIKITMQYFNKIIKDLNHLISKYNICLIEEEVAYFKKMSFESNNFYGLQKIHKSKTKEIVNTQNSEVISVTKPFYLKVRLL